MRRSTTTREESRASRNFRGRLGKCTIRILHLKSTDRKRTCLELSSTASGAGPFDSQVTPSSSVPERSVHADVERILLSEGELGLRVRQLAAELGALYAADEPTVIAVLKGSVIFVADLIRQLSIPLRLAFLQAESYRQDTRPGTLELGGMPPEGEIRGRRILLVDDILDSGRTLATIRARILAAGARDVRTCTLLDKPARRAVALEAEHVGFRVEDHFVVGYGLDFAGRYRNLPYVGILRPEVLARASEEGGA